MESPVKDHQVLWQEACRFIRDNINPEQYEAWFSPISSLGYDGQRIDLQVPSQFFIEQLEERYARLLTAALDKAYGKGWRLTYNYYQVGQDASSHVAMDSARPASVVSPTQGATSNPFQRTPQQDIDSQLNPRYTFENYCCSVSNKVASSIGRAIAENPDCHTFNPLFIFGAPGVGKTHLIQAIGIGIKEKDPKRRVLYVTARLFESQYTAAVRNGKINDFIAFYQSIDVLIIDDIQDFVGKTSTQNTFFHIFNHLHQNRKQLILSSDTRPSAMEGMDTRLLSRFKWGMTAELEHPDYQLRRDVLQLKARQDGLDLPEQILDYIATNVTDSVRELEGVVVSLIAHATVLGSDISLELARAVLANAVKINRRQLNFEMIVQEVSAYYDIEADRLFTTSRKREVSDARQMIMYLAKKHAMMTHTAIGRRLDRTHATVLYACRNVEQRLSIDKKLHEDLTRLEELLLH